MTGEILPFDLGGQSMRFGKAEDGTPWVVAADYAKAMGYAKTQNATDLLDEDEKGHALAVTPGGTQRLAVIYEDGMWELIFRSSLPGAKALKGQVKAILRKIRETGRYEVSLADPLAELERQTAMTTQAIAIARAAERRVAALEPDANAWSALASAVGDYSLRDAAHILNRDPNISTGQNRLMTKLFELGMVDRKGIPYAKNERHLRELPRAYEHPHTKEAVLGKPQIRITILGLRYLHERMGGTDPLRFNDWPATG